VPSISIFTLESMFLLSSTTSNVPFLAISINIYLQM
jgi:hypothetical protein